MTIVHIVHVHSRAAIAAALDPLWLANTLMLRTPPKREIAPDTIWHFPVKVGQMPASTVSYTHDPGFNATEPGLPPSQGGMGVPLTAHLHSHYPTCRGNVSRYSEQLVATDRHQLMPASVIATRTYIHSHARIRALPREMPIRSQHQPPPLHGHDQDSCNHSLASIEKERKKEKKKCLNR